MQTKSRQRKTATSRRTDRKTLLLNALLTANQKIAITIYQLHSSENISIIFYEKISQYGAGALLLDTGRIAG